jgi:hypothetical protein
MVMRITCLVLLAIELGCSSKGTSTTAESTTSDVRKRIDIETKQTTLPVRPKQQIAAIDISLDENYGCYRDPQRVVHCWGRNASGEVGDGTEIPNDPFSNVRATPVPVKGIVAEGDLHTSGMSWVVHPDHSVTAWGSYFHNLQTSSVSWKALVPTRLEFPSLLEIGIGSGFLCVLTDKKVVMCQGYGGFGALGDGRDDSAAKKLTPAALIGFAEQIMIVGNNACARSAEGTVLCWGIEWGKDLGVDSVMPLPQLMPEVRESSAAPKRMLSSVPATSNHLPPPHPMPTEHHNIDRSPIRLSLTNIVNIAGGYRTMCAVDKDGAAWCWSGQTSQLPTNPTPKKITFCKDPIRNLAVGAEICAQEIDGDVCCEPSPNGAFDTSRLRGATHLTVRSGLVCGIVDQTLRCAGSNGIDEHALWDSK